MGCAPRAVSCVVVIPSGAPRRSRTTQLLTIDNAPALTSRALPTFPPYAAVAKDGFIGIATAIIHRGGYMIPRGKRAGPFNACAGRGRCKQRNLTLKLKASASSEFASAVASHTTFCRDARARDESKLRSAVPRAVPGRHAVVPLHLGSSSSCGVPRDYCSSAPVSAPAPNPARNVLQRILAAVWRQPLCSPVSRPSSSFVVVFVADTLRRLVGRTVAPPAAAMGNSPVRRPVRPHILRSSSVSAPVVALPSIGRMARQGMAGTASAFFLLPWHPS
jgi:hypothetical protein